MAIVHQTFLCFLQKLSSSTCIITRSIFNILSQEGILKGYRGTILIAFRRFFLDTRRSRYIGLAKTHLQQVLTATAVNLIRAAAWLEEIPFAR
jgi:hypothetical protein